MRPEDEQRHLIRGQDHDERAPDVGTVDVRIRSNGNAARVLDGAKQVLLAVLEHAGPPWPSLEEWRAVLPDWFVEGCAPEMSPAEAEQWLTLWRSLPPEEQARATRERRWALAGWLYWLEPAQREWYWWNATVEEPDSLHVVVQVEGWPAPLGALDWLLRVAGGNEILMDDC